jgi:hypothetical protein
MARILVSLKLQPKMCLVLPSQHLEQNRCSKLIPFMGQAVQKQQNELFGNRMCCFVHKRTDNLQFLVPLWFLFFR